VLLDEGYRVVALDGRGHGLSAKPTDVAAYEDDATLRDVAALFDHLHLDGVLLVGYSMGGELALRFADGDPRISALALLGIGTEAEDPAVRARRQQQFIAALESDSPEESEELVGEFRLMAGLEREPLLAHLKAANWRRERPERIDVPMIVIVGVDDLVAGDPAPLADRYGATLLRTPGDHFTANAKPELHAALLEFLGAQ
jgi:pimeloyl-ACP methyl ester carboxylesterase